MSATRSTYARPPAERLAYLYTTLGLGCPDIGWLYGRDAKTIHSWLRQAAIPTRGRGTDPAQWLKPGDPRSFAGTKHSAESRVRISASSKGRKPTCAAADIGCIPCPPTRTRTGRAVPRQSDRSSTARPNGRPVVKAVWQRADACCERCSLDWRTVDRATTPTFNLHHIVSFQVKALRAEPSNLALLCRPCHLWVHSNANTERLFLAPSEELAA